MVDSVQIHLFYPLLFTVIIVLIITIGIVLVKYKDGSLFQNIFYKSSDNAKEITIDATDKLSKAHTEIVEVKWDKAHEQEMHSLEMTVKEVLKKVNILMDRYDVILERIEKIENRNI